LGLKLFRPLEKSFDFDGYRKDYMLIIKQDHQKTFPPSPLDTALVLALTVPVFTVRSTFGSGIPKVVALKNFSDFLL